MKVSTAYFTVGAICVAVALYSDPLTGHLRFTMAALICATAAFCAGFAHRNRDR